MLTKHESRFADAEMRYFKKYTAKTKRNRSKLEEY